MLLCCVSDKAVFEITMHEQVEDREKNRVEVVCMFSGVHV